MMRITGGMLCGRKIQCPRTGLRPTQDRVREAIFSSLAARLPGARVLDLFSGTGSLGLEALSRGAGHVCFVEKNPAVFRTLQENVRAFSREVEGEAVCRMRDVWSCLSRDTPARPYDIVLADPPYDREGGGAVLEKALRALTDRPIVAPGALFVFEQGASQAPVESEPWALVKDKRYGGTRVLIYARTGE